jgi:hypothetical protein
MDKVVILRRIDALEQMLRDLRNDVLAYEEGGEAVDLGRQGTWRLGMLSELLPRIEHLPGAMALLDLTAERSPEVVTFGEVLERSGLSEKQQSGDHSRLSWTTKRLFGKGEKVWPLDCWQAADGVMHYRMPTRIAKWWRTIRGQQEAAS